tara:strand:- start:541 stop:714 length:174 start_codon:yes stop_codon:yes gene_type:complete
MYDFLGGKNMNKKTKEFLELIEEYQTPINEEIKDDKKAEEVWNLMSDLESKLEEVKI